MNAWLSFAQIWLIDLAMLATALLATALFLRLILRDAKSRVLLAWGTWLGIAAAALVTLLPGWPRYEWSAIARKLSGEANVAVAEPETLLPIAFDWSVPVDPLAASVPIDGDSLVEPFSVSGRELALLAWTSGAILGLAWIALGCCQARRLLRQSQAAPDWVFKELTQMCACAVGNALRGVPSSRRGLPDVRTTVRLNSAVALRARKPAIVLPLQSADPSNAAAVRAALAHEWAHIRHGDLWLLALERLLLPLLALHPLFWWLRRSTRLDQELLADAAAAGDKPVEYAEALVAWAKTSTPPPAALAALAFWERPSNLTRRVHMILHQPRPVVTRFRRLISFVALACLLALVGGLSVVTLQPLAAEDEPTQRATTPAKEAIAEPPPIPAALKIGIMLRCTVIEVNRDVLAEVLPLTGPQPTPETDVTIQTPDAWHAVLQSLQSRESLVVTRPQVITLSGQEAKIGFGAVRGWPEIAKALLADPTLTRPEQDGALVGISVTPTHTTRDGDSLVQISLNVTHGELVDRGPDARPDLRNRKFDVTVNVPVGKTVTIGHRPLDKSWKALVVAIEPKLVDVETAEAALAQRPVPAAPPAVGDDLVRRLDEVRRQLARQAQADDPESRREAAAVRHTLLRLQREIAALLDQMAKSEATANPLAAPAEPAAAPNRQNIKPGKVAKPTEARQSPQLIPVSGDAEKVLNQLKKRLEDWQNKGVTVTADSKGGSLIVSGSEQQIAEVRKLLFEIERTAAASSQQQLQQKLLELDLREAEIGLQAAKADYAHLSEIRSANTGAISNSELRQSQLKVELAQVQLERMKVRLEAARAADPPPTPARR